MKVQKRLNRKVGTKEYVKWYVNLSTDIIKQTGWKQGEELEAHVKDNGELIIKSKKYRK